MDIQPVNTGHVLVVPREHHESLFDVPRELGVHLFDVTMRVAAAVKRVTACEGMNIVVNSGAAAGQDEFHYHVHIIPRRKGDGFDVPLPFEGSAMPDRTLLDAAAARISAALRDPIRHERRGRGRGEEPDPSPRGRVATGSRADNRATRRPRGGRSGASGRAGSPSTMSVLGEGAHGEMLRAEAM
jgi:histidine triad (HIT) family protein